MKGLTLIIVSAILLSYASSAQQSQCDYKVEIIVDGEEFEPADFTWRMRATKVEGKSTNITGTAKIETDGRIVKSYKPWTSAPIAKQKTSNEYTPNLKPGSYEISAEIKVDCDDTNNDNNEDIKAIKINGEKEEDKKSKNENREIINNELDAKEKTQSTQSTAIKQQKPAIAEETDNIIQLNTNNQNNQKPQITAYQVQQPSIAYESSNEKAKSLIIIFLLTLSILLNIILILRR